MKNIVFTTDEIKPCPFCGKKSSLLVDHDELNWFFIHCSPSDFGCGTTGPGGISEEDALEKWNIRV